MVIRLGPEALLDQRKSLEAVSDRHRAHLYSLQTQLGTWLVLGNGIALFTLAQAVLAGRIRQDFWLTLAFDRFIVGLALAFFAMTMSYFLALYGLYTITKLSTQILVLSDADKRADLPETEQVHDGVAQVQISAINEIAKAPTIAENMQAFTALNVVVYTLSGVFFLCGLGVCWRLSIVPPLP